MKGLHEREIARAHEVSADKAGNTKTKKMTTLHSQASNDRCQAIRNLSFIQFIDAFFKNVRFENCIRYALTCGRLPFNTIGEYLDAREDAKLILLKIPNLGQTSLAAFDRAIESALDSDISIDTSSAGPVVPEPDSKNHVKRIELAELIRSMYPLAFDGFLTRYKDAPDEDQLLCASLESELQALNIDPRAAEVAYRRFLGETLETIGDRLGLTRERVRQIEVRFKPLLTDINSESFVRQALDSIMSVSDSVGLPGQLELVDFHPLLPSAIRHVFLGDRSTQGNAPLSGKERRLLAERLGLVEPVGEQEEIRDESKDEAAKPLAKEPRPMMEVTGDTLTLTKWLHSLLESRTLDSPDHRMLYAYDLLASEFESLEAVLVTSCQRTEFSRLVLRNVVFPPLFVLYASEWWKREYEGGPWDWDPILERLTGAAVDISPQARSECVTLGLLYWGHRPLADGMRFLGAIVAQGGIPMRLLAQGSGKLPVVLTQVIKFGDRYRWSKAQILDGVKERLLLLPRAYRRPEIASLLADFAETVLHLKQEYKLGDVADPIAYLDQNATNWKQRFPVSLEHDAAQTLLVGLVREAASQKTASSHDLFRCERRLVLNEAGRHRLESHLVAAPRAEADALAQAFGINSADKLQRYFSIDLDCGTRRSFLEARLVLGSEIPAVTLNGRRVIEQGLEGIGEHVLILRSAQGDFGERITVPGGGALPEDDPWLFVQRDDEPVRFVAAGSARLPDAFALVALPNGWQIETEGTEPISLGVIENLGSERSLYRIEGSFLVRQPGLSYRIRLGQSVESGEVYQWSGTRLPEAHGKPVFRGAVPSLYRVGEDSLDKVTLSSQEWRRQSSGVVVTPKEARGPIDVLVRNEDEVVGRQRIVILPPDARIEYTSGEVGSGIVRFSGWGDVDVAVLPQPGLQSSVAKSADRHTISLQAEGDPPGEFQALVHWHGTSFELPMWLAFPVTGGRFVRSQGGLLRPGERISIRDLIGTRLQVFDTNPANPKAYSLLLVLGSGTREVSLRYPVPLDVSGRAEVRLIDYQRHIESLLGMTDLLDSTVSVRLIVGQSPTAEFVVARYAVALERNGDVLSVDDRDFALLTPETLEQAQVLASPLVAELPEPVRLVPVQSEGVLAGAWDAKGLDPKHNPWFIYPGSGSSLQFRPTIWIANEFAQEYPSEIVTKSSCDLADAMLDPDPEARRDRVHYVVRDMSRDLNHPSWPLVNRLWTTFNHLPLPALDVWRMIAKRPRAVLAMLLRLDLDAAAVADAARRFRDEVGWIPELTAVSDIREAASGLWNYWSANHSATVAKTVFLAEIEARLKAIGREIPGIDLLIDLVLFEITGAASESLQSVWDVCDVKSDVLVRTLWQGQESVGNTLLFLVNSERERKEWPEPRLFEKALDAYAETLDATSTKRLKPCLGRLFWFQPADDKFSVANLPMLCALWSATSAKRTYWSAAGHRLALKRVRDFDPVWFEQAFRHAFMALLSMDGIIDPERFIDLPD